MKFIFHQENYLFAIYKFELTASVDSREWLKRSSSVYIEISPSGITANLVPLGTSIITSGFQQNLELNPGNYSIDPDYSGFNSSVCFLLFVF